jgi:hypothetical protein
VIDAKPHDSTTKGSMVVTRGSEEGVEQFEH